MKKSVLKGVALLLAVAGAAGAKALKDHPNVLAFFGKFELPKSGEVAFTIRPCNAYGVAGKPLRISNEKGKI